MKHSAGILPFRLIDDNLEVMLVHPGGPFWKNKDSAAWSIPKGEFSEGEDPLEMAIREFNEETGTKIEGDFIKLTPVKQKGGKIIHAWACEVTIDPSQIRSNTFDLEWPPKSGNLREFPEVDRGEWFSVPVAKKKINPAQGRLIDELKKKL